MDRRRFIASMVGVVLATPLAARAQQAGKVFRIGFLWESPDVFPDALEAFRQGLRELGYVEGRNIAIDYRWAEGKPERMRQLRIASAVIVGDGDGGIIGLDMWTAQRPHYPTFSKSMRSLTGKPCK